MINDIFNVHDARTVGWRNVEAILIILANIWARLKCFEDSGTCSLD